MLLVFYFIACKFIIHVSFDTISKPTPGMIAEMEREQSVVEDRRLLKTAQMLPSFQKMKISA